MRGKHVTLNLGTNDILKRELPNYPHQGGRPCRMRWEKALTHLFHKFEASFIREVLICEIPKFHFISPEMSTEERYFFLVKSQKAGLPFSELRQSLRDTMNINLQKFADQWSTKRGIRVRTRMINFEGEIFVNRGRNIHIDRNSQVQRLRDIRKLYKIKFKFKRYESLLKYFSILKFSIFGIFSKFQTSELFSGHFYSRFRIRMTNYVRFYCLNRNLFIFIFGRF